MNRSQVVVLGISLLLFLVFLAVFIFQINEEAEIRPSSEYTRARVASLMRLLLLAEVSVITVGGFVLYLLRRSISLPKISGFIGWTELRVVGYAVGWIIAVAWFIASIFTALSAIQVELGNLLGGELTHVIIDLEKTQSLSTWTYIFLFISLPLIIQGLAVKRLVTADTTATGIPEETGLSSSGHSARNIPKEMNPED